MDEFLLKQTIHYFNLILILQMLFYSSSSAPPSDYATNMSSESYNYYDTSSYWNSYSAWQQGYYESEPTSDGYNNYTSDRKPEEDELELIGMFREFIIKLYISCFATIIFQIST